MNARDNLIKLCQEKQAIIGPSADYFNNMDLKDLQAWPEVVCQEVWKAVKKSVRCRHFRFSLFNSSFCPWCIRYDECEHCAYAKNHKQCDREDSDWNYLLKLLYRIGRPISLYPKHRKTVAWLRRVADEEQ